MRPCVYCARFMCLTDRLRGRTTVWSGHRWRRIFSLRKIIPTSLSLRVIGLSPDGSTPGSIGFKTIMTSRLRPSKGRVESSDHGPLVAKWKILSIILQISVEYMAGGLNLELNLVLSGFGTE